MINCSLCDEPNIEGDDFCRACGHALSDTHLYEAKNPVERGLLRDRISGLTPKTPIVARSSDTVGEVLSMMVQRGLGCMFILDNQGSLVGVFSERDALLRIDAADHNAYDQPISSVMTPSPEGLDVSSKISFAVQRMDLGSYRHVPIMGENKKLDGVISVRDILGYLSKKMNEPEPA